MFYNVENLFDCKDDSIKADEEFLPDGSKHWNQHRLYKKLNGISKTILAANKWETPAIIGLCEVENQWTLKQLIYNTGLSSLNYHYIHYECMDKRGIDVALLYRKKDFRLIKSYPIHLSDSSQNFYTRDALYVNGVINTDTLHIIVNHWPSKRGGEVASESKREKVAQIICTKIDSINSKRSNSKLILMGDFNATLSSPSMQYLCQNTNTKSLHKTKVLELNAIKGTYKYQGKWSVIDHILISQQWLNDSTYHFEHQISNLPFLLEDDKTNSGKKPHRTYAGPRYIGGVSDHLPVLLNISQSQITTQH